MQFANLRQVLGATAAAVAALSTPHRALAATPDVSLSIENPNGPVVPGQLVVYRIHLANANAVTPTGALTLEATIPQFMAVNRPAQGSCAPKRCDSNYVARYGNVVRWSIPSLPPATSVIREFAAVVDNTAEAPPPPDGATLALEVIAKSGAIKAAGTSSSLLAQRAAPNLDLSVIGTTHAAPGSPLDYTLRFGNRSSSAVTGVLRMPLPAGTRALAASSGAALKGNVIEWDLGSLPAGYTDSRSVRLELDGDAFPGTLFPVEAEFRTPGQKNPVRSGMVAWVASPAALALKVVAAPDPAGPGGTVLYKVELTNTSPNIPTGKFTVQASIPDDAAVNRPPGGDCSPKRCDGSYWSRHGSNIYWNVPTLTPGATTALQYALVVDRPTAAAPPNGAILSSEIVANLAGLVRTNVQVAVATPNNVGNTRPLVPFATEPPPKAPEPDATVAAPAEEFVEEDAPPPAPPKADKAKLKQLAAATKRSAAAWTKYCQVKWEKREWDNRCVPRWHRRPDYAKAKMLWRGRWKG